MTNSETNFNGHTNLNGHEYRPHNASKLKRGEHKTRKSTQEKKPLNENILIGLTALAAGTFASANIYTSAPNIDSTKVTSPFQDTTTILGSTYQNSKLESTSHQFAKSPSNNQMSKLENDQKVEENSIKVAVEKVVEKTGALNLNQKKEGYLGLKNKAKAQNIEDLTQIPEAASLNRNEKVVQMQEKLSKELIEFSRGAGGAAKIKKTEFIANYLGSIATKAGEKKLGEIIEGQFNPDIKDKNSVIKTEEDRNLGAGIGGFLIGLGVVIMGGLRKALNDKGNVEIFEEESSPNKFKKAFDGLTDKKLNTADREYIAKTSSYLARELSMMKYKSLGNDITNKYFLFVKYRSLVEKELKRYITENCKDKTQLLEFKNKFAKCRNEKERQQFINDLYNKAIKTSDPAPFVRPQNPYLNVKNSKVANANNNGNNGNGKTKLPETVDVPATKLAYTEVKEEQIGKVASNIVTQWATIQFNRGVIMSLSTIKNVKNINLVKKMLSEICIQKPEELDIIMNNIENLINDVKNSKEGTLKHLKNSQAYIKYISDLVKKATNPLI